MSTTRETQLLAWVRSGARLLRGGDACEECGDYEGRRVSRGGERLCEECYDDAVEDGRAE